ncbi:RNA demethylase ALKBH5-like [Phalaenopsis equestris]|uniref:RNA demethylase ALKBH5-like n=1 Tax=Phalaenopsis equestris TaxID=78828 RepID=UPI0009E63C9C|nr:RNA demethylase ALKBH5-like [Phalaenopsis equestris]
MVATPAGGLVATNSERLPVKGRIINILEGLEMYTRVLYPRVFSESDERSILDCIFDLSDRGRAGLPMERTYSEPKKWMRGKGRITIECGCCYNFTNDRQGNPPGILRYDQVDPLPSIIKLMIKGIVRWSILPATCIPNSFIINIYDKGDCIRPHVDHHDFVRPFNTVSYFSKSNILFGKKIGIVGPGEFRGTVKIPLQVGSVLVLKGNGANVAKHCIPGVRHHRVFVTFHRMDNSKIPYGFQPDPKLEELLSYKL